MGESEFRGTPSLDRVVHAFLLSLLNCSWLPGFFADPLGKQVESGADEALGSADPREAQGGGFQAVLPLLGGQAFTAWASRSHHS